jgi:uncharacterized protein DUF4255/carboxypeptidase family protein
MIQDFDRTLARLLRDRVPLREETITFDVPNEGFRAQLSRTGLTVNLYLYDIRENHELRSPEWRLERQADGSVFKRRPRVRLDLFYVITAWSPAEPPDVLAEHALLSQIIRTLFRYPTIPPDVLQGAIIGQEPPLPTLVAQPDGLRNPAEFWGALRQPPRLGIHLAATIAMEPTALSDELLALTPVVSRDVGLGPGGGTVYQLGVRPPLAGPSARGRPVRRMSIASTPAARLQQGIFASRQVLRVIQVRPLPVHEWILIDDAANREFVALAEISAADTPEVTVTPALRFTHDPTAAPILLRRAMTPDADVIVTSLDGEADAEEDILRVSDRDKVTLDDVLLISDGEQTEVVQVVTVTPGSGTGDIRVRPSLRFHHRPHRNLYKRLLEAAPPDPATATRLAAPAAQPGSPIVLDSSVPQGTVLMIGSGPGVEFTRLDTAATVGVPVAIVPPLRHNHAVNTPLRRLTPAEVVGQLSVSAVTNTQEVLMAGESTAVEEARLRQHPLVSPGEVLQLDDQIRPVVFQTTAVTEASGMLDGMPEEFFTVGGWVVDDTTPPNPIAGALVILRELGLRSITDRKGQFSFANLLPGPYRLQVTAPGYQAAEQEVEVPPRRVGEYRLALRT